MGRPAFRFQEFIGQEKVVKYLRRLVHGALARQEPFLHTLLIGPSGIGKTLLAQSLAKEYGTELISVMGYISRPELAQRLMSLKECGFFHVDECHRLGFLEQELLFEAIDGLSIPDLRTGDKRRLAIPPFALVLSTDQPGRLLNGLQKRMGEVVHLDHYTARELREIVATQACEMNVLLTPQAIGLVARASHGLPRLARLHLQGLRLHFEYAEKRVLPQDDVRAFFRAKGIDSSGLGPLEHQYLRELAKRGTASREALSLLLGVDHVFLTRAVEENLLRRGLIQIRPAGRCLTAEGKALIESRVPQSGMPAESRGASC